MRLKITEQEKQALRVSEESADLVNSWLFWDAYDALTAKQAAPVAKQAAPSLQSDIDRANGKVDGVLG